MMIHYVFLMLRVCSIAAMSSERNYRIYVDPLNGNNTEDCLHSESIHQACATLEFSVSKLSSSTQVVLVSGIHTVNNKIQVSNCQHIAITGLDSEMTVVTCPDGSNAGIEFVAVQDLLITGIRFENCGSVFNSTTRESLTHMALFRSAVYILNSTDVIIETTSFVDNRGVGLSLFDVSGYISVLSSNFTGNSVPEGERDTYNGGGGLYIEHTYCTPGCVAYCDFQSNPYSNYTTLNISDSQFSNNHGSNVPNQSADLLVYQQKTTSRRLGNGGGITVTLKGLSHQNTISIVGCTFENNSAGFGGGIDIQLQDYVTYNKVHVHDCQFLNNNATNGGGGVFIGIFYYEGDTVHGNRIALDQVNFTDNIAQYGGGMELASSRTKSFDVLPNYISFIGCNWYSNKAMLGAAVLLDPEAWSALTDGQLPVPLLKDCRFENNEITTNGIANGETTDAAEGALYSSTYTVNVSSSLQFIYNKGTAFSATAGSINILKNSTVVFWGNSGTQGGALALLEFASLHLFPGSHLVFDRNFATDVGGAIYAAIHDTIDFYYSRNCFIRYHDQTIPTKDWDATIKFWNNSAGSSTIPSEGSGQFPFDQESDDQHEVRGSSIFAVTICPCIRDADTTGRSDLNAEDAFPQGVYYFEDNCYQDDFHHLCGVSTAPVSLRINPPSDLYYSEVLKVSPGESFNLGLTGKDELNNTVHPVVVASLSRSANAVLDSASQYVADGTVQISGEIGATFSLELSTFSRKKITMHIRVQLVRCPPGFVYQNSSQPGKFGRCVCSATTQNQQYQGITKCNTDHGLHALLNKGFWAGCNESGNFLTAECPLGYCRLSSSTDSKPFYRLSRSCDGLDKFLCEGRNRTGDLCGNCSSGLSVFYHSQRFSCHSCHFPQLGWLFYALSELLPTVIVFVLAILFNIRLTSGTWYSVVLYAQIIDFYEVNSLEFFQLPQGFSELTNIYRFFYGMFNLDFFKYEDKLSFCLWDGATVLDVLIFKYLTTAFAVVLLVTLILCFRSPCWSKCENVWERSQRALHSQRNKSWVIHGISTFLIISYAQCAKVSFEILTWTQLQAEGYQPIKRVVFLSGTVEYFSKQHLPYAIPALFVVVLIIIPPLFLIVYPNIVQVVSGSCDESERVEDCCNRRVCSCFRRYMKVAQFKPVIDSFQGCFKDRYRFFAGLFFLYRFVISLSFAYSTNAVSLYISLEMIVILMLAFHSLAQPYEKRFYNLLDTFMFCNLAIVNGLSLFNYYWVNYSSAGDKEVIVALTVQLILVYIPIVYIVTMCTLLLLTSCSRRARRFLYRVNRYVPLFKDEGNDMELHDNAENVPFDDDHLPHRMFDDEHVDEGEDTRPLVRNQNYGAVRIHSEPNTDKAVHRTRSNKTL